MAEEWAAVKRYLDDFEQGKIPRPRCPVEGCKRNPHSRGARVRKRVFDSVGNSIDSVPIPRFKCPDHGWIPYLPECLLPYVRTVVVAVEEAFEKYVVEGLSAEAAAGPTGFEGRCVRRWVAKLLAPWFEPWVAGMLDELRPDRAALGERPPRARPGLWRILTAVRQLADALRERKIAIRSPLHLLWSRSLPR